MIDINEVHYVFLIWGQNVTDVSYVFSIYHGHGAYSMKLKWVHIPVICGKFSQISNVYYFRQLGGYVFVFVCLSVGLLAT